jgi:hypothetical protein
MRAKNGRMGARQTSVMVALRSARIGKKRAPRMVSPSGSAQ